MTAKKTFRTHGASKRISVCRRLDAEAVRERLRARVLSDADQIIESVIESARTGNYLPAKFLFEFAGIMEPTMKSEAEPRTAARLRSLVELLLDAAQPPQAGNLQETPEA